MANRLYFILPEVVFYSFDCFLKFLFWFYVVALKLHKPRLTVLSVKMTNTKSKFLNLPGSTWTNLWKCLQPIEQAAMINGCLLGDLLSAGPFKLEAPKQWSQSKGTSSCVLNQNTFLFILF